MALTMGLNVQGTFPGKVLVHVGLLLRQGGLPESENSGNVGPIPPLKHAPITIII